MKSFNNNLDITQFSQMAKIKKKIIISDVDAKDEL